MRGEQASSEATHSGTSREVSVMHVGRGERTTGSRRGKCPVTTIAEQSTSCRAGGKAREVPC